MTFQPWPALTQWVRAAACCIVAMVAPSVASAAETHALLIGASRYLHLPADKSLRAPANDVRRMKSALMALGVRGRAIDVLADGVEGSKADPTTEAILKAFDALPQRASPGDRVIIYMSGHGTQIPDDNGDEDDGLDEAFLPVDAVPPPAGAQRFDMTNVIRDDRIGELIDALRRKDVHVWLVVDSCHSGTISRALSDEQRAKEISAVDFGLPLAAPASPAVQKTLADTKKNTATGGSFVAFYASQADEMSMELAVPRGAPKEQQTWVSAFTDAMIGVLERRRVATYRELLDETARSLRAQIPPRTRQTPGHDGDALDQPLLGGALAAQLAGLAVDKNKVQGGLIAGLEPGTVVSLHERAGEAAIAHAQVTQADALAADIVPIVFPCAIRNGAPSCERLDAAEALARARVAQVAVPVTRVMLRVSRPRDWPGRSAPGRVAIEQAALVRLAEAPGFVVDDVRPDFIWYRTPEGARFMPSWTAPEQEEFGPSVVLDKADVDDGAGRVLAALERTRLLMRLERVRGALPSNGLPIGVATVATSLVRYERDANGRCRFAGQRAALEKTATATTCDGASVQIRNGGTTPVFAYVFALDDSWVLHPLNNVCRQGAQNRIDIGGTRTVDLQYRNGSIAPGLAPRTRNGVLVFAVPFEPGVALPMDPCRLVRAMTDGTRSVDGGEDPIADLLAPRDGARSNSASSTGQLVMAVETWPVDQGGQK